MAHTTEMIDIAIKTRPNFCCIVPEKRNEVTTEEGLNLSDIKILHQINFIKILYLQN